MKAKYVIRRQLHQKLEKYQHKVEKVEAFLGDASENLLVSADNPYYMYARLIDGTLLRVWNYKTLGKYNDPVWLGYEENDPYCLFVLGLRNVFAEPTNGGVPIHSHEIGGPNPTWVWAQQFMPWLVLPVDDFVIKIFKPNVYTGSSYLIGGTETIDLTDYIPDGGALFVLVQVLTNTGMISIKAGLTVPELSELTDDYIPLPDASNKPKAAIRLYAAQPKIEYGDPETTDVVDLRNLGDSTLAVETVTGDGVDNSDPVNPTISFPTPGDIGLENVDNTSDEDKPVSTAQAIALAGKISHSLATAVNDFLVASGAGTFVKKTLAETITILRTSLDSVYQASLGYTAENVANKDTDGTLAANSDTKYASQKATKTYVDGLTSNASIIGKVLTGLSLTTNQVIAATDTILQAFGYLQAQITGLRPKLTADRTYYVGYDIGTVTMTIASPCVVTKTAHGLQDNDPVIFRTTGALPTGLVAGTTYYVKNKAANTFEVAATAGGASINTSGSQSGTHSAQTGADTNDGLSTGRAGALATIQKAIDLAAVLDIGGYVVTIQVADGLYNLSATITCKRLVGGTVVIQGNSGTPANVQLVAASAVSAITLDGISGYTFKDFLLTGTGSNTSSINAINKANFAFSGLNFGAAWQRHLRLVNNPTVEIQGSYTISGGCLAHWYGVGGVTINHPFNITLTVTLSGTPAFSTAFADIEGVSWFFLVSSVVTYSGAATGARYKLVGNSMIDTNGGGANKLPGNSAGTNADGTSVYA